MKSLLCTLEDGLDDDEVMKAVKVVGENIGGNGRPIWVLNEKIAIDENGEIVTDITPFGLVWLSHLIDGNRVDIAKAEYKATVSLPLSNKGFDVMCHFLRGHLATACSNDFDMSTYVENLGVIISADDAAIEQARPGDGNQIFLSVFSIVSMACITANYEEVRFGQKFILTN
jgi:hypothetical protein